MEKEEQLKFQYDNYEEDFDNEEKEKGEYQVQTDVILKKNEEEQEYSEDFNKSAVKVPVKSNPNRQKMIEQNIKLKTQIFELAKQMDEILQKQKKKKKYGINADQEDDEAIKDKKKQLKKQYTEIMHLKQKIQATKRHLQQIYDSRGIQQKQDQLKNLQKQLNIVKQQKQGLLRVKKEQIRAFNMIKNDDQYQNKIKSLKEQQNKLRQECKLMSEKVIENERLLRKSHEQYLIKHNKVREMQQKIKENAEREKNKKNQQSSITNAMVDEMDKQLSELQKERKESEAAWMEKISSAESELHNKKIEEEKKLLILKEKQKELKLNDIKVKQLKKLIQHHKNQLKGEKKVEIEDIDTKQYRHKRNIKYLQKK